MENELQDQKKRKSLRNTFVVHTATLIGGFILDIGPRDLSTQKDRLLAYFDMTGLVILGVSVLDVLLRGFIRIFFPYLVITLFLESRTKKINMYEDETLSALLSSGTVGIVLDSVISYLNYPKTVLVNSIISFIVASLFIYLFVSGEEKEAPVKKAVIIARIILLMISIGLNILNFY